MKKVKEVTSPKTRNRTKKFLAITPIMLLTMALMATPAFSQSTTSKQYIHDSNHAGEREDRQIEFTGRNITIPVIAVEPGKPDTTFEIHGQVDPAIVVPAGTKIRFTLANMDSGMSHSLDVTETPPPYKTMTGLPMQSEGMDMHQEADKGVIASTGISVPNKPNTKTLKLENTGWFVLKPGQYYYVCPIPGHAHKGMYGKIIAR